MRLMDMFDLVPVLVTWDSTFESKPAGSRSPKYGDDDIREHKEAVRERIAKEHVMTTGTGTNTLHGWHLSGSARGYVQTGTGPTTRPDGSTSLGASDAGRVWFDSGEDYTPHVWTGTAWQGFAPEVVRISIQGSLATTGDAVPPVIFPQKCDIRKVTARVGTAPTTQGIVFNIVRMYSSGAASVSLFQTGPSMTIAAAGYTATRTQGQMTTTGYSLSADDYLKLSITQVGTGTAGADLGITIEALLETNR